MIKEKKSCLFCDSTDLSREHIYSTWLVKLYSPKNKFFKPSLHKVKLSRTNERADYLLENISDGRKIPYNNFKVKNVCTGCNNGWMSELENSVKSDLSDLLDESSREINFSPKQAEMLSKWAIVKCMLIATASQEKVFFPKMFYRFIKNGIIPEGFMVECGRMNHKTLNFAVGGEIVRKAFEIPREQLDWAAANFFKASLHIGYAVFRVSFLRTEIPVFRIQMYQKLTLLYPYLAKLPFQNSTVADPEPEVELPLLNASLAITD